jgi:hypothetical protein
VKVIQPQPWWKVDPLPRAQELAWEAEQLEKKDSVRAQRMYRRAAVLHHIAARLLWSRCHGAEVALITHETSLGLAERAGDVTLRARILREAEMWELLTDT